MDQTEICNLALDAIHEQPITDIDTTTDAAAVVLKRNFDAALKEFLGEAHWWWAKKRDTLAPESPAPDFGWAAKFALPSDFVSLVAVNGVTSSTPSDSFELEGGYILTDETSTDTTEIDVEYIYAPTASQLDAFLEAMDGKAAQAFALLLASKVAPTLAKDGLATKAQVLQLYYGSELPKARTRNANMNRLPPRFPYQESTNLGMRRNFTNR